MSADKFTVALCQTPSVSSALEVSEARKVALASAKEFVEEAKKKEPGLSMVILPEMFNCPYGTKFFEPFAETVPGPGEVVNEAESPSTAFLVKLAKENSIWLIGGSISEGKEGKVYNTSLALKPDGTIVAKHRKVHLFDINVPGKITFKESDTLTAGSEITTFEGPWGTTGLAICYDVRFAELALCMRERGAKVLIYPGAFNSTTGPAHWKKLMTGRALDTQTFVVAC
eukprot:Cvel_25461.t1-p1 / transcript=Cvel_25461.t1 / gene=Cvel_25461 / organism=Chromera_velia_CCMP2878 / gene_product=Omega-amidase NIT2, putative / transcript_product=Omega-amidase NIT2, putative / location=Cvel_scaffold2888:1-4109(-) / protein_length=227 / sequence_SO=supercontig / SO=protein_coding / is_pseudo=false